MILIWHMKSHQPMFLKWHAAHILTQGICTKPQCAVQTTNISHTKNPIRIIYAREQSNDNLPLQWRQNGRYGVSNHQPHDCLLTRLFRRRSKKTSTFCITGLCAANSTLTGELLTQMTSNGENVAIRYETHMAFCKIEICVHVDSVVIFPQSYLLSSPLMIQQAISSWNIAIGEWICMLSIDIIVW